MNLSSLIELSLDEDIGPGDLTTDATIPASLRGHGSIRAKAPLIVCGHEVAARVFAAVSARYGGEVRYEPLIADGAEVERGKHIARLEGSYRTILLGERLALNFLMRMSGIATTVRPHTEAAGPDGPRIVDTRKTTPLHRALEKYAVRCGGGHNHRFALYDGVMIKDNHLVAVGDVPTAVRRARQQVHHLVRIEVEVANLDQLREALATDAEVIMLDNMDDATLAEAVRVARATRPVVLEASGNMNPARIAAIRHLDLDVISVGGLIHQARWVDLSLELEHIG